MMHPAAHTHLRNALRAFESLGAHAPLFSTLVSVLRGSYFFQLFDPQLVLDTHFLYEHLIHSNIEANSMKTYKLGISHRVPLLYDACGGLRVSGLQQLCCLRCS
jgi:hypothetical protein